MGDSSAFGETWPGPASAEDLGPGVTAAATPLASGASPVSSSSDLAAEGNPRANSSNEAEESPALLHIQYMGPAGLTHRSVSYRPGLMLQRYLQQLNLIGMRMRCALVVNGKRVRMSYVPRLGDVIGLLPVNATGMKLRQI